MKAASIDFQARDFALLIGLFEARLMTARHIAALFFDGKNEAAKKRLQKLKAAGVVAEKRRRCYEPSILFLTPKAFSLLREEGLLADYPPIALKGFKRRTTISEITLRHELAILDVKMAFYEAIKREKHLALVEFSTWPLLHQFQLREVRSSTMTLVKPDGFIRIHETDVNGHLSEYVFFLEVDRGSETLETLVQKAICYNRFYREGGMAQKHGRAKEEYKDFPFRVLFVVQSQRRQVNLAETLVSANPPILTQAYLATFQDVTLNPLKPVWKQPISCRSQAKQYFSSIVKESIWPESLPSGL
jgi:hypothetical protein